MKISRKQKHWNHIIDTNEMNFQNISIQCLPNVYRMSTELSNDNHSHGTRHTPLLYQLPTKTSTGQLCIRHCIPELLTKTPDYQNGWLKIAIFAKTKNYYYYYYCYHYYYYYYHYYHDYYHCYYCYYYYYYHYYHYYYYYCHCYCHCHHH